MLYAVYDLLERRAGCRWFWDGDVVPRRKTLAVTGFDLLERPRFDYRGLRYFAHRSLDRFQAEHWDFEEWKHEIDWIVKKKLNTFMLRLGLEDLFQRAFPETVSYPGWHLPEATPRSYNDRTPFWPLKYRGELHRKVIAYARERDLIHPEDVGTMTHWYSRTPHEFLEKVKPSFIPQVTTAYREETGLVWDIRDDKNLDNYFKLTQAHIRDNGQPGLFHTIGLAERRCYQDKAANHEMKLYAYRRIIAKLRERSPDTPLLLGSWDFIMYWSDEEVKSLIAELDPRNTLVFDYTSDIHDEEHNFTRWGLKGKFPWTFGIFHTFEPGSDIRGAYDTIEKRLPQAAADPMCRGFFFWPECSHSDTLMLEYFSRLAWTRKFIPVEDFIGEFCAARYPEASAGKMAELWLRALPLIRESLWGEAGPLAGEPIREVYPHMYFQLLNRGTYCWSLGELDEERQEFHRHTVKQLSGLLDSAASELKTIAAWRKAEGFLFRDQLDLARTIAIRMFDYVLSSFALALEGWQLDPNETTERRVRILTAAITKMSKLFSSLLAASEEFSLAYSLDRLNKVQKVNSVFEDTFKRTAVSHYCRSFMAETAKYCYEFEWQYLADRAMKCLDTGDRRPWRGLLAEFEQADRIITEAFARRSLEEMRPEVETARKNLPGVLRELAELIPELRKQEVKYVIF